MRKYRLMEEGLNKSFKNVKDEVREIEKESKIIEENERFLDMIKNYSFEQLMELNKNR